MSHIDNFLRNMSFLSLTLSADRDAATEFTANMAHFHPHGLSVVKQNKLHSNYLIPISSAERQSLKQFEEVPYTQ